MKAEIIRGRLIAVNGDKLTIAHADIPDGDIYRCEDIDVDEKWTRTWLGEWADWVIINGAVKEVKSP